MNSVQNAQLTSVKSTLALLNDNAVKISTITALMATRHNLVIIINRIDENIKVKAGNGRSIAIDTVITPALTPVLNRHVIALITIRNAREIARDEKKMAATRIKADLKAARLLIREVMLPLMRCNFATSHPSFFHQFKESFQVVDAGNPNVSLFGSVVRTGATSAINEAVVMLMINNIVIATAKSGRKGYYRFQGIIPQGIYNIKVMHPEYNYKILNNVIIIDGKGLRLNVELDLATLIAA